MPWNLNFRYNLHCRYTFWNFKWKIKDFSKFHEQYPCTFQTTACMHLTLCSSSKLKAWKLTAKRVNKQVKPGFTNYQPQPSNSWAWSEIEGRGTKTRKSNKNRKSIKTFWSFMSSKSNLKIWKTWKFWKLGQFFEFFWKFLKLWKVWKYGNSRNS